MVRPRHYVPLLLTLVLALAAAPSFASPSLASEAPISDLTGLQLVPLPDLGPGGFLVVPHRASETCAAYADCPECGFLLHCVGDPDWGGCSSGSGWVECDGVRQTCEGTFGPCEGPGGSDCTPCNDDGDCASFSACPWGNGGTCEQARLVEECSGTGNVCLCFH